MTDKALISNLTWRSLDMQRDAFPDMPHFTIDEISSLMRPTSRNDKLNIHVLSLAIIADKEAAFVYFLKQLKVRKAALHSKEEDIIFYDCKDGKHFESVVNAWKIARRDGAAKIGARISADRKKASTKERIAKIKDRWPMPSKEWPTKALLLEADLSLNTVKSNLGSRIIAQHNYQAKLKRRERLKKASDAKYPRMKRATNYIDEAPDDHRN